MAILEYDEKHRIHPEGWIGIRISVLGVTKEYKSKYYNFRDRSTGKLKPKEEIERMREEAYKLHLEWRNLERHAKDLKHNHIHFCFYPDRKRGKVYPTLNITAGKIERLIDIDYRNATHVSKKRSFVSIWNDQVKLLLKHGKFSREKKQLLKNSLPSFNQVNQKRLVFNRSHPEIAYSLAKLREVYD